LIVSFHKVWNIEMSDPLELLASWLLRLAIGHLRIEVTKKKIVDIRQLALVVLPVQRGARRPDKG
jgi:hypothetical protein